MVTYLPFAMRFTAILPTSVTISIAAGTQVSIYTIDSVGNHSDTVLLIV